MKQLKKKRKTLTKGWSEIYHSGFQKHLFIVQQAFMFLHLNIIIIFTIRSKV